MSKSRRSKLNPKPAKPKRPLRSKGGRRNRGREGGGDDPLSEKKNEPPKALWVKQPGLPHGEKVLLFTEAYDVDLWADEGWEGDNNPSQAYTRSDIADRHKRERDKMMALLEGFVEEQRQDFIKVGCRPEIAEEMVAKYRIAIAECQEGEKR